MRRRGEGETRQGSRRLGVKMVIKSLQRFVGMSEIRSRGVIRKCSCWRPGGPQRIEQVPVNRRGEEQRAEVVVEEKFRRFCLRN